jgi:restriction system protein
VTEIVIPSHFDLMWPTLEALKQLGGSGRIDEIVEAVIQAEGFTEEQQEVRRRPGDRMSKIEYRLAWARNNLKNIGAAENSARGVWAITDVGRGLDAQEVLARVKAWRADYNRRYHEERRQRAAVDALNEVEVEADDLEPDEVEPDWKEVLLERLLDMSPDAFERLAQRLLREAGFRNVEVLGKSGDGGIDGVGVYRLSLVSFPVYFQCKRWASQVGAGAVRDFRGAMSGRGDKGLLITTATFSPAAREEATRDGAPPVDLISGEDLCDLLRDHELGVKTTSRMIEEIDVVKEFFDEI